MKIIDLIKNNLIKLGYGKIFLKYIISKLTNSNSVSSIRRKEEKNIIFRVMENEPNEILKLCENGDIFVKGKLIENDKEVVDAMREFLIYNSFLKT